MTAGDASAGGEGLGLDEMLDSGSARTDVGEGAAFEAWRLRPLSLEEFSGIGTREHGSAVRRLSARQLAYLCWAHTLAPSSHNTVPQRFRINATDGSVSLWLDRQFVLSSSDPTGRQAAVGLGCGLANMLLVAAGYGWQGDVELLPVAEQSVAPHNPAQPRLVAVATVTFRPVPRVQTSGREWVELMLARKTIRAEYDERVTLPSDAAQEIRAVAAQSTGLELHVVTDAPTRLFLGKFQETAETTMLNRDAFSVELGEWILGNADTEGVRGMRGAEFGLSTQMAQRFRRGLRREVELLPDELAGFAKAGNVGMRSASAVIVLTVDEDTLQRRLSAGRVYQEVALRLWKRGFCTAMHAGITEVQGPNLALRGRLRTRWRPTVLFRVGKPLRDEDWQRPHAARPQLADLLLGLASSQESSSSSVMAP